MNYTIIRTLSIVFQIHVFAFNEGEMVVLCVEWRKREYSIVSFIFKMYVRICIYIIKKKKATWKKTFGWWDCGCLALFLPWNICIFQIYYNNTITFITRKIFSRQLYSVPSGLTSGSCRLGRVNSMQLRRMFAWTWPFSRSLCCGVWNQA